MEQQRNFVDLHTHSTASDGTDSPAQVVAAANAAGLAAVALTDHDTVDGLDEACAVGRTLGIPVVRGCELAVGTERGEVHILGLWLPESMPALEEKLRWLRQERMARNAGMVGRLQALGLDVRMEEVLAASGGGSVGRPHIASVLLRKGYVRNRREAFQMYLGQGGKAWLPKTVLTPEEALDILIQAGATASWAHPLLRRPPLPWVEEMLSRLVDCGLSAIEAFHSDHAEADVQQCLRLARRFGIGLSGGSDYHGANKPTIRLGRGYGGLRVSVALYRDLLRRREAAGLAC